MKVLFYSLADFSKCEITLQFPILIDWPLKSLETWKWLQFREYLISCRAKPLQIDVPA